MRSTTTLVLLRYITRLYARHMYNAKTFVYAKVQDQIDVTKQLVDLYPFIDKSRVGSTLVCLFCTLPTYMYQVAIWGWSYGGFVTASVLAADADQSNIFKVSVFLLNQNHQRFSSSAASALPQSPTGSTTIPSTLRGCFSNIFWLKYVQCSLN